MESGQGKGESEAAEIREGERKDPRVLWCSREREGN